MIGHRRITVADASAVPGLGWAESRTFTVPDRVAGDSSVLRPVAGGVRLEGVRPELLDAARELRAARMYAECKPMSSRLPFSYQRVPQWARTLVAKAIGGVQRGRSAVWADFPGWPLDLSADFLAGLGGEAGPFAGGPAPVILSHDLDTEEGLDNALEMFLPLEERYGARSVNFLVPAAWELDHGKLAELTSRGHGLGIHGYDHSNLTPYMDDACMNERLCGAAGIIERYGARGYRAPSLVRTRRLLAGLAGHYRYDSSVPTSGGLFPVPNNGCASARPFRAEGLWELPLSMPRDGSLRFLWHRPGDIARLWEDCARTIAASGGVVVLLTHCERRMSGRASMLEAYERFLEFVRGSDLLAFSGPERVLDALEEHGG